MCHVLVIEDEWVIAEQVAEIARASGATSIDTADNQEEAVDAARAHVPDIILSDVRLVHGTGPMAVQAIQAHHGPIPVIFITGSPDECQPCNPPGIILSKPIDERAVTEAFRRMAPL
ncbi:response regulator [uncultured Sphingomonas sp.]|uniref:response regulator n=1 Tax=uncultured Sphingomonas sp. TaxID=158754 RepID=UPI0025FB7061|nr:response regulator [uncultured Sphingomonas sp.]